MAIQKQLRFLYQSKNFTTGLADVKAQVYVNGVAKAVGASAITATEVDATNSPGVYEVVLSAANLTTWGVAQGVYSAIEVVVNSASKPAEAIFREEYGVASLDDIDLKLGTPAGASVSADLASVKSDTAAIKIDLETGASSLSTILSNIQSLQNASIGNGIGFVLPEMLVPSSGSNTYKIPITVLNDVGALVDPASNTITIGVLNQSGTDRGSYLTGSLGSPATVVATRNSIGQYSALLVLPSTAIEEQLLFSFSYTLSGNATVRYGQAQTLTDISNTVALQSTLLSVQSTVNTINTNVSTANTTLTNATYGLSALQTILTAIEGTGFVSATDSNRAISTYLTANLFSGGRAV